MTTVTIGQSSISRARLHVYPDIQHETDQQLFYLHKQVDYSIRAQPDLAIFVGDLVQTNNADNWAKVQYEIARLAAGGVKWLVVPGNHDSDSSRITLMNDYLAAGSWVTGLKTAGQLQNSYSAISMGGQTWIVLCLEFSPRTATVAWAANLLAQYATNPAILVTHCYLYEDGTRYDWTTYGAAQLYSPYAPDYQWTPTEGISDGQDLWNSLVSTHANVRLVLSGHDFNSDTGYGSAHRVDTRLGTTCVQILQDFQEKNVGAGYLREVDIDLVTSTLYARTTDTIACAPLVASDLAFSINMG